MPRNKVTITYDNEDGILCIASEVTHETPSGSYRSNKTNSYVHQLTRAELEEALWNFGYQRREQPVIG